MTAALAEELERAELIEAVRRIIAERMTVARTRRRTCPKSMGVTACS
jgi:hypothetical protein